MIRHIPVSIRASPLNSIILKCSLYSSRVTDRRCLPPVPKEVTSYARSARTLSNCSRWNRGDFDSDDCNQELHQGSKCWFRESNGQAMRWLLNAHILRC